MKRHLSRGILSLCMPLCLLPTQAWGQYVQTNLVSSRAGLATITDPQLVNPWGLSLHCQQSVLDFEPGDEYGDTFLR